ncbi:MAG: hypothetical protein QOK24_694 [Verrucomicrobiota bacterium]|jgi:hypothetical protein
MGSAGLNLLAGWVAMLAGAISGAMIGLYFHREEWLGGYSSFPRRMVRLGHISFWGLGLINLLFALTVRAMELSGMNVRVASAAFILGLITMPLCCFLTAWRKPFRHFFPIPVLSVAAGIVFLLLGWAAK